MQPRNAILFVDDEKFFARPYRDELGKQFEVYFLGAADEALEFIVKRTDIKALILDIMMPTPEGIASTATGDGLDTGIWLLGGIRELVVKRPLPVLVLTNRDLNIVKSGIEGLGLPPELTEIRQKVDTPAHLLPSRVQFMMTRWHHR